MLAALVVLGGAIYIAVDQTLGATGLQQLEARAQIVALRMTVDPLLSDRGPLSLTFGGATSGTFAVVVAPNGQTFGGAAELQLGLPVQSGVAVARTGRADVQEITLGDTPARVLSEPVQVAGRTFVVQVVQDRTAEQRTLDVLLLVLAGGGLLALAAAIAGGTVYAGRALVPIRESLRRQREFAADASHELRTPLAVIRASVEHLRHHPDAPVRSVGAALGDIEAEVGHMTSLVDDLLLLARTDSGAVDLEARPLDLAEVAVEALPALAQLAQDRNVRLQLDPAPAPLNGDQGRLRQLVAILVDNAIRHGPPGGEVLVRVRSGADGASLEVEDQGPGIPLADRERVFDRFWRAPDATAEGTGLGLAIARWIVEAHQGSIGVEDRPGGGARFHARLRGLPAPGH